MAKFLNKKEQVFDIKLTSYGNYLLSIGKFKPIYYEFFDDNVLYDGRYGMYTGSNAPEKSNAGVVLRENQNLVHKRIKEETPLPCRRLLLSYMWQRYKRDRT